MFGNRTKNPLTRSQCSSKFTKARSREQGRTRECRGIDDDRTRALSYQSLASLLDLTTRRKLGEQRLSLLGNCSFRIFSLQSSHIFRRKNDSLFLLTRMRKARRREQERPCLNGMNSKSK